jgi:hypothetical protein
VSADLQVAVWELERLSIRIKTSHLCVICYTNGEAREHYMRTEHADSKEQNMYGQLSDALMANGGLPSGICWTCLFPQD